MLKKGDRKMLTILKEIQELIPPLSKEELQQLECNIKEHGCLDPIITTTINSNQTIIDGHNRYAICKKNKIEYATKNIKIDGLNNIKIWVIENQFGRRNLSDFSRAELALTCKEILAKQAKERMADGGKGVTMLSPLKTRDVLAKNAGISQGNITKVEKIKEKVKDEEIIEDLRTGKKTINKVFSEIKVKERREEIEKTQKEIDSGKHSLPKGKYEIIVIDPPWQYSKAVDDNYNPEGHRGSCPYPTMTIEEIKKIEIPSSKDCVLWLWTTHRHMRYAFELLDEWGFTEKSILTWCKQKMGIGKWLRSKSEFCVMAVKGKPKVNLTNETTVLEGKSREHSRKPDEFYAMVEKLCVGRKLDYFSREKRKGWDTYGSGNTF